MPVRIRTFDSILSTLRGGENYTEALGLDPASLVVIETDGSYEQVDSLKAAFDGAPDTGTDVFGHSLDPSPPIRASRPASRGPPGCARPASNAPSWPAAVAASTRTGTGPPTGSTTRRCTAPTCSR